MKKTIVVVSLTGLALVVVFLFLLPDKGVLNEKLIRESFLASGSASCLFLDPGTQDEIEIHFKDKQMKIQGFLAGHEFFLINKDNFVYSWSNLDNQGIKFLDNQSEQMGFSFDFSDKEKFVEEIKEHVVSCSESSLSQDFFDLPEQVEFYDASGIFENGE
jgi:hypothetical protein